MDSHAAHVLTITNSIIGVSLLAMPYCFKQCGIILSICMLLLSNAIARLCCHLMLKSAVIARRRTFEYLAFHAFGSLGKFTIEIGLIGFLLGTSIAYFVVMGDLGPAILAKLSNTKATDMMRTSILLALALFCVLPLGLLRNIDSLNSVCIITVGFYFCLVLKIISEAVPHIISGDWTSKVELWRPTGILQCLPIFSMALSCQTQIFEIYQALPTASLEKMNNLIRSAVNICTGVYIFVGVFGYVAFATQAFTGNILMSFTPSFISDLMKIGFVLSLAFSFPLIIFPCRASLNSLLCRHYSYSIHDGIDKYIPESRFKGLTFLIISISLCVGILIPNIELVLGLLGSTIGVMICVLFPATCFICVSTKNTNERILAQAMLFIGVLTMVLGTYANLYAIEETVIINTEKNVIPLPKVLETIDKIPEKVEVQHLPVKENIDTKIKEVVDIVRHEPPQPIEPVVDDKKVISKEIGNLVEKPIEEASKNENLEAIKKQPDVEVQAEVAPKKDEVLPAKKVEEVDIEAIKKEEKEIFEEEKEKLKDVEQKNIDLIKAIEKQNEAQQKVVEESKKILEEIKQRQQVEVEIKEVEKEKMKAVEEIKQIAQKAIERLNLGESKKDAGALLKGIEEEPDKKDEDTKPQNIPVVENPDKKQEDQKPMPLPLVISNLKGAYKELLVPGIKTTIKPVAGADNAKMKDNISNLKMFNQSNLNNNRNDEKGAKEEVVLHREIRSVDDNVLKDELLKKTEASCNKNTKINEGITDTLLSKLITKVSDPELVSIKSPNVDSQNLDIQPLKRDLKSFKDKRK